jgi:hypothetical protein
MTSKKPQTWNQYIQLIAKRLHDPTVLCTQEDRDKLADILLRQQSKLEAAMKDDAILYIGERSTKLFDGPTTH